MTKQGLFDVCDKYIQQKKKSGAIVVVGSDQEMNQFKNDAEWDVVTE